MTDDSVALAALVLGSARVLGRLIAELNRADLSALSDGDRSRLRGDMCDLLPELSGCTSVAESLADRAGELL